MRHTPPSRALRAAIAAALLLANVAHAQDSAPEKKTTDLDEVYAKLNALKTNGGSELVARVSKAALDQQKWTDEDGALKLIFVRLRTSSIHAGRKARSLRSWSVASSLSFSAANFAISA